MKPLSKNETKKARKADKLSPEKPDGPAADSTQSEPSGTHQTKRESEIALGTWPAIDEKTLRQMDEEALKRCRGDVALWYHHRALLEGEFRIHCRGKEDWRSWVLNKHLPQYKAAEASVIEGWRKLIANTLFIPRECQAAPSAIARALIFDGCRRAKTKEEAAERLKQRAQSIKEFAASGDVRFFRSLGRLLSPLPRSSVQRYDYVELMLKHWLASFLWIMPERTAADCLAGWRGEKPKTAEQSDKRLRHFKETKRDYKLRSHKPSLIHHIEPSGKLIHTPQGRSIIRSLISSK